MTGEAIGETLPPSEALRKTIDAFLDPSCTMGKREDRGENAGVWRHAPDASSPPQEVLNNFDGIEPVSPLDDPAPEGVDFNYTLLSHQLASAKRDSLILKYLDIAGALEGSPPIVASLAIICDPVCAKPDPAERMSTIGFRSYVKYLIVLDMDSNAQPTYDTIKVFGELPPPNMSAEMGVESPSFAVPSEEVEALKDYLLDQMVGQSSQIGDTVPEDFSL